MLQTRVKRGLSRATSGEVRAARAHLSQRLLTVCGLQIDRAHPVRHKRYAKAPLQTVERAALDAVVGGQAGDVQVADAVLLEECGQRGAERVASLKGGVGVLGLPHAFGDDRHPLWQ